MPIQQAVQTRCSTLVRLPCVSSYLPDIAEVLLELSHGLSLLSHLVLHTSQSICASRVRDNVEHRPDGLRRSHHRRSDVDHCLRRCVAREGTNHRELLSGRPNLVGLKKHAERRWTLRDWHLIRWMVVSRAAFIGRHRSNLPPMHWECQTCAQQKETTELHDLPVYRQASAAFPCKNPDPRIHHTTQWALRTASTPKCHC